MAKFSFDEESHTYYLDKVKIPSVSEIIAPLSDYSGISPAVLENACNYGKAVHKTIELYIKGTLDEDNLSEPLKRTLIEYQKMAQGFNMRGCEIIDCETMLYDEKLRFAGTLDIITDKAIIDIKTRKYNPTTDDLQLAGYEILAGGKREKYILELLPDRPYGLIKISNSQAKSMFLYMLDYWHRQNEYNKKLEGWKK